MDSFDFSNKNFKTAADFIRYTDEFIFLTGKAGTGKTTFLKYIKDRCEKKYILTAPTGVAAINAGGVTLHSFFQLPIGTFIADYHKSWGEDDSFIVNRHQLLSKIRIASSKRKLMREMELLIIDEISMVRADMLDAVDVLLRHIRQKPDMPFGGVQLLVIGDLFQLPPVVKQHELSLLAEYYQSPFFFDAHCLREQSPICIELDKIYRQDDPAFITLLNNIRNNELEAEDFQLLQEKYVPGFSPQANDGVITLTSHNAQADELNQTELARLPGAGIILKAKVSGDFPENAFPIESEMTLKVGAQIMFMKNDKGEARRYYNGKIGMVNQIDLDKNEIEIYFSKEKTKLNIQPEKWENIRYKLNDNDNKIEEDVVGTFEQFPFRLAWAVTIHKSQGLTFEEAVIDAGRSFAAGQVYVALSRLTSLKGLILRSKITPASIHTDPRIIQYMSARKDAARWTERLELGKRQYLFQKMVESFSWTNFILRIDAYLEESVSILTRDVVATHPAFRDGMGHIRQMEQVGRDFSTQIYNLYKEESFAKLAERMDAAKAWMDNIVAVHLVLPWQQWQKELVVVKGGAKAAQIVRYFLRQLKMKMRDMQGIVAAGKKLAETLNINDALEKMHEQPEVDSGRLPSDLPEEKPKKIKSSVISFEMFTRQNLSVDEVAAQRGMVRSTIISHLAQHVASGELPIEKLMPMEQMFQILDIIKQNPTDGLADLKMKLQDAVSYEDIRLVQAHLSMQKEKENR